MRVRPVSWAVLALMLFVVPIAHAAPLGETAARAPRRYALVLSQNLGDPSDEPLRFADEDARRIIETLQDVGGVAQTDAVVLHGATAPLVRRRFAELLKRLEREATARDQLIVYASSHADSGELHLAGTRLPLSELTSFIARAPVGVALLIVDSCRSGALTRLKGLKPVDGTQLQVHTDVTDIQGRVIITSSGADEYAQESDELRGSFFTHHLVSALRGAADRSGDGRVTLDEGYAYAYARTLDSTFGTRGGLQRPSYRVELKGHGELVLSEVRRAQSRLTLQVEEPGIWQLVARDSGQIWLQLDKPRGHQTLGLPAGSYRVRTRTGDGFMEGVVTLVTGGAATVKHEDLRWVAAPAVALKAGRAALRFSVAGAGATPLVAGLVATYGAEVRVHRARPELLGWFDGWAVAAGYREGRGSLRVRFEHREVELRGALYREAALGRFRLAFGPELGSVLATQGNLPDGRVRTGLGAYAGASAELRHPLGGRGSAFMSVSGGAVLIRKDSGDLPTPRATAAVGVSFDLG